MKFKVTAPYQTQINNELRRIMENDSREVESIENDILNNEEFLGALKEKLETVYKKIMADLSLNFAGIKSPNPFWLASAPPTVMGSMVERAFDAGWEIIYLIQNQV